MKKYIATLVFIMLLFVTIPVYAVSEDIEDLCRHASYLAMVAYNLGYEGQYSCEAISKEKIRRYFEETRRYGIDISSLDMDKIHKNLITICESGRRNRQNSVVMDPLYIRYQFRERCEQHPELLILKTEGRNRDKIGGDSYEQN